MVTGRGEESRAAAPCAGKRLSPGVAATLRFAWRHIVRSKLKTALTIALAAGFTAGIAGAAVSAMLIVRKNPMELLQMRE